ncbi:MAG: cytochrome b [Xanthobacteraceae bacterium]
MAIIIGRATATYSMTARIIHWLIAAIILIVLPIGLALNYLPEGPFQDFVYNLHRSLGATLIPLVALRVIWRLTHTPPPLPADIPAVQRIAASATHFLLYLILIAQPIIGWIATSAYPAEIPVFGLFKLPPIWSENRALSDALFKVHWNLGVILTVLLFMHIGGALYHQFIRRDEILRRMWF